MKIFMSYLKDRKNQLLSYVFLLLAAGAIHFLFDIPALDNLYILLVWTILISCFLLPDSISYFRKAKELIRIRETIEASLTPPKQEGTLPEQLLISSCERLCQTLRAVENTHELQRQEMLSYYTLWVHQVKTPLAAMRLILESEYGDSGASLFQELFKVERYVDMVLGYLRLPGIHEDLQPEPVHMDILVRKVVKKFAPLFIYQKLTVEIQEFSNVIISDEKWLGFILEQLLSNALKYTEAGSITIAMNHRDVLTIRDTGMGIAPEDLPRIFHRGFTGKNGRLSSSSSGLGLYLVHEISQRLAIPVSIQSTLGEGTTVSLDLYKQELKPY